VSETTNIVTAAGSLHVNRLISRGGNVSVGHGSLPVSDPLTNDEITAHVACSFKYTTYLQ